MMLKKISHIVFSFLVVSTTMGLTVSSHYCGDVLQEVSIVDIPDACCDDPDCCHDESETYVIDDSFSIISFDYEFTILAVLVPSICAPYLDPLDDENSVLSWVDAPPHPKIQTFLAKSQAFLL